ncbi:MAG: hypothetical protein AAB425_13445 [Bdellovibrionota bacterium]
MRNAGAINKIRSRATQVTLAGISCLAALLATTPIAHAETKASGGGTRVQSGRAPAAKSARSKLEFEKDEYIECDQSCLYTHANENITLQALSLSEKLRTVENGLKEGKSTNRKFQKYWAVIAKLAKADKPALTGTKRSNFTSSKNTATQSLKILTHNRCSKAQMEA